MAPQKPFEKPAILISKEWVERIIALEKKAYDAEPAWRNARMKYLGRVDLGTADQDKIIAYGKHMNDKLKEQK